MPKFATTLLVFVIVSGCSATSSRDNSVAGTGGAGASGSGAFGGVGGSGVGGSGVGGSSGEGGGIAIPDSGGGDAPECGGQTFPLERKPAKVLLVLDRSGSMEDPPDGATTSE